MAGSSPSRKALDADQVAVHLADLPKWTLVNNRIERTLKFGGFRGAMVFLMAISYEAEELDHHPEITNVYSTVTIRLTTHDAGNRVSEMDIELARRIDSIAWV